MVEKKKIRELADRIAREFKPDKIILFGSHAWGRPGPDSDVDLLVIMKHEGAGLMVAAQIMEQTLPRIPVDIVVRSPEEVKRRLKFNDFFLQEIISQGRVLYESTDA